MPKDKTAHKLRVAKSQYKFELESMQRTLENCAGHFSRACIPGDDGEYDYDLMVKACDLASAFEGRVRAALILSWVPTCRRCTECQGREHHWQECTALDLNDGDDFEDVPQFVCKHCGIYGEECPECDWSVPSDDDGDCDACQGEGVIPKLLEGPI